MEDGNSIRTKKRPNVAKNIKYILIPVQIPGAHFPILKKNSKEKQVN